MIEFSDKSVVVTGAANGIGRVIAKQFAERGASVGIVDVDESSGQDAVADVEAAGGDGSLFVVDVSDRHEMETAVEAFATDQDGLDVMVNNAGIGGFEKFMDIDEAALDDLLDVNVRGTWNGCRAAIPHLTASNGAIVNVASMAGLRGFQEYAGYCTTKAAVMNLTRALAAEFSSEGVRVNAVCPGTVDSERIRRLFDERGLSERERQLARHQIPMQRFGAPEEVANGVLFLASELATYVTGHGLVVDGGRTATA